MRIRNKSDFLLIVFLYSHDESQDMAFIRVCLCVCLCVCVSVCLSARQNQNGWSYNYQTCHRDSLSRVLAIHLILGQKVKGQGHRVTTCKNIFQLKAIECPSCSWHYWLTNVFAHEGRRAEQMNSIRKNKKITWYEWPAGRDKTRKSTAEARRQCRTSHFMAITPQRD